jgi:hypothetical protein
VAAAERSAAAVAAVVDADAAVDDAAAEAAAVTPNSVKAGWQEADTTKRSKTSSRKNAEGY